MIDPVVAAVIQKLQDRAAVGLAKYGVGLSRTDLTPRQWLQHLQEELLDAAGYVQCLLEGELTDDTQRPPKYGTPRVVWRTGDPTPSVKPGMLYELCRCMDCGGSGRGWFRRECRSCKGAGRWLEEREI